MKAKYRVICLLTALLMSGCIFTEEFAAPVDRAPDAGDTNAGDTDTGDNNEPDTGHDVPDTTEPPLECTCELPANAVATCTAEAPGECTFVCAEGFASLEGDAALGCSCELVPGEDVPGDDIDSDCDGFDGTLATTVFVAPGAEGTGLSPDAPMGSIAAALALARDEGRRNVFVVAGTYEENLTLEDGIHIYGGFTHGGWSRDVAANEVVIVGRPDAPDLPTVLATGLEAPTRLDGLTIRGPNLATGERTGATSYGVLVVDSQDVLEIIDSTIVGGVGDDGKHGAAGEPGAAGESGEEATSALGATAGDSACGSRGGGGGTALTCESGHASVHGSSGNPRSDDSNAPGAGGEGGAAGSHGCTCPATGGDGATGNPGQPGAPGEAGAHPESVHGDFDPVTGRWHKAEGRAATGGQPGGGGGGGGAGGSATRSGSLCSSYVVGGGGGGGGGGGCGGTAGENGEQGGGSFALLLVNSSVRVEGTTVVLGASGNGGNGGDGAPGGDGGQGQNGHDPGNRAGAGGRGGRGGAGGAGAPGAGGCGGLVVGAALVGEGAKVVGELTYQTPETSTVGAGGAPGSWPAGVGGEEPEPCNGERLETRTWLTE